MPISVLVLLVAGEALPVSAPRKFLNTSINVGAWLASTVEIDVESMTWVKPQSDRSLSSIHVRDNGEIDTGPPCSLRAVAGTDADS